VNLARDCPLQAGRDDAADRLAHEGVIPHEPNGGVAYERDPAKLELRDVRASAPEPADPPFTGCEGRCSGINWYCIENPHCFEPK
jgi:hypothetical protein